jgi:hypothetical protein
MSAASLWFDAKPPHVTRLNNAGKPLGDRLRDELLDPTRHASLNPLWKRIEDASAAFWSLLNTPCGGEEAFDWLNALTNLPAAPGGVIPTLEKDQGYHDESQPQRLCHQCWPPNPSWQWSPTNRALSAVVNCR